MADDTVKGVGGVGLDVVGSVETIVSISQCTILILTIVSTEPTTSRPTPPTPLTVSSAILTPSIPNVRLSPQHPAGGNVAVQP
jgi:hypothetical protein